MYIYICIYIICIHIIYIYTYYIIICISLYIHSGRPSVKPQLLWWRHGPTMPRSGRGSDQVQSWSPDLKPGEKCDTWIVYPDISQSNTSDCPFSPVMMDNFCDYPIIPVTIKHWQWRIPIYTCFSQENTLKPLFGRISQPPPLPLEACRRGKMPSGSTG